MGFVLGLHGPALSGKDTVADYLVSKHGWDGKLSFAQNLKEMCKAIFFLTNHDTYDQDGKLELFNKPRVFTDRNLGSVLHWMSRTCPNPHIRIPSSTIEQVKSLVGTELVNPRHILQFVGTDICRELVPTYHVDVLVKAANNKPDGRFVVTDVRFPNEGDLIQDRLGGIVVELKRPTVPGQANIDRMHASETSMLEWGRFNDTIDNDREGLEYLYETVDRFLERNGLCQTTQS